MLDRGGTRFAIRRPVRAEADDVARVEVRQFQPILGDVAGRKEIILPVLPLERIEQVLLRDGRLFLQLDRALDGVFFGAFDDGGNDRATGQIAPIKVIVPAAPKGNVEKAVNIRFAVRRFGDRLNEGVPRFSEGKVRRQINPVDFARGVLVGTADANLAIDAAGAQNGGVDAGGAG